MPDAVRTANPTQTLCHPNRSPADKIGKFELRTSLQTDDHADSVRNAFARRGRKVLVGDQSDTIPIRAPLSVGSVISTTDETRNDAPCEVRFDRPLDDDSAVWEHHKPYRRSRRSTFRRKLTSKRACFERKVAVRHKPSREPFEKRRLSHRSGRNNLHCVSTTQNSSSRCRRVEEFEVASAAAATIRVRSIRKFCAPKGKVSKVESKQHVRERALLCPCVWSLRRLLRRSTNAREKAKD